MSLAAAAQRSQQRVGYGGHVVPIPRAKTMRNIAAEWASWIDKAADPDSADRFRRTGFSDLDDTAGPIVSDGRLIVLGARPGIGKTAFAQQLAEQVAKSGGVVLFFSLEMGAPEIFSRTVCCRSGVALPRLERPRELTDEEWSVIAEAIASASDDLSTMIVDDTSRTIDAIKVRTREIAATCDAQSTGLSLIVIDYLQLIQGAGRSENRTLEVGGITGDLKKMANDYDVPVLALSQLSRALEGRPDKHPQMSDLRDSGEIEQHADVVMFLYRDEVYHPDSQLKGTAEVSISKNRSGPIGDTIRLAWRAERCCFGNLR